MLRDSDVVILDVRTDDIELEDPVVRLEDSEEDKVIVAGASEKRFVTFLQQMLVWEF